MARNLVCGRWQLLRLLRLQRSYHSVAVSLRPLAAELLAARRGNGRPPCALLAVFTPRCISTSA
ncbi:oxidase assembly 1-like, isoform CRA_b [Mus musculus]|nr:oxidase assembly 1-like, isoform CRA_b [Mus musculus]